MSRDRYRNRQLGPYTYPMAEGQATSEDEPAADYESESARAKNEQSRPSADKRWEVRGAIAAAAITAVVGGIVAIVVAIINHSTAQKAEPPGKAANTTSVVAAQPTKTGGVDGSITHVTVGGQDITISGTAGPGVTTVIVLVPRASGQGYWAGSAPVASDLTWRVQFPWDGGQASPPQVMAYFSHGGSQPGTPPCTSPECLSHLGPPAISKM